jgi:hypothetical protein
MTCDMSEHIIKIRVPSNERNFLISLAMVSQEIFSTELVNQILQCSFVAKINKRMLCDFCVCV